MNTGCVKPKGLALAVQSAAKGEAANAVVGFDGFVDEVVHVVDSRESPEEYSRIRTILEYGQRIIASSGQSGNLEFVTVTRKLGGNGAIFANALKRYGVGVTYVGSVGLNAVDPIFSELADSSTVYGVAEPATTDAVEFEDGKIITSKLTSLNGLRWDTIKALLPPAKFAGILDAASLFSFNNWTMIPAMNGIWRGLLDDVLPLTNSGFDGKLLFIDIADPEKRGRADLLEAVRLLKRFCALGLHTILGLNLKEAQQIYGLLELGGDPRPLSLKALTEAIFDGLGISELAVHPVDRAACCSGKGYFEAPGDYCEQPRLTTGAGDNFNAGYIYGRIHGFAPRQCLRLGVLTSGYYVRNGESPCIEAIVSYIESK